tara:strand:+ start:114 stop:683 length:570 start_codon:yes stop_codon:yes gene_type:complete
MTTTTKKTRRKSPPQMKVIDKFLPTSDFIAIRDIFQSEDLPWYLGHGISGSDSTNAILNPLDNYYFVHLLYFNYMITSQHFEVVKDAIEKALKAHIGNGFNTITRIKANLYTRTEEVQVHPFHSDTGDIDGLKGALISLNTCDGYTGFHDGTEVDSVENRCVIFDSSKQHHSTSTSNAQYRLNINVNFL